MLALAVLVAFTGACGKEELPPPDEKLQVPFFTGGYVPEAGAIRLGWRSVDHPRMRGYSLWRTPAQPIGASVSEATADRESMNYVEQTTATSYDDRGITLGHRYGYALAVTYGGGQLGAFTPITWVDAPFSVTGSPSGAGVLDEACDRATAYTVLKPDDRARPGPSEATAQVATAHGYALEATTGYARWHHLKRGGSANLVASESYGVNQGCDDKTLSYQAPTLGSEVYAIRVLAEIAGRTTSLYFPVDEAAERVRWQNLDPAPGKILRAGYQTFRGGIAYGIEHPDVRQLSAMVEAVAADGTRTLLDIEPFDALEAAEGVVGPYATGVVLPDDTTTVRLIARFSVGAPDEVWIEDVVEYAVVR